jgi:N utilization substance protein B
MRLETRARSRALQAIYAWDLRGGQELERVSNQIFDDLLVPAEERKLAGMLLRTLREHGRELDAQLAEVTTNWRLERLGVIERCVLRLAAAELHRGDTPPRVVLRESIRLAERYGTPESAKFVNGVLDALARKMGRL